MASIRRLLSAESCEDECEALRQLLQSGEFNDNSPLDLGSLCCESRILECDRDEDGRNSSQSLLDDLLLYVIVRNFGATAVSAGGNAILGIKEQVLERWWEFDAQHLTEVHSLVQNLHELLLKSEWKAAEICTLGCVTKRVQDPRARQKFLVFAFQIVRFSSKFKVLLLETQAGQPGELDAKFFDEAVHLMLLGVTDLWSAIRKDCAKMAAVIAFEFPSKPHIDQFIDSLIGVAIGSRSVSADKTQVTAWTEREGALLTLLILISSIKTETISEAQTTKDAAKVSQVKDDIMGRLSLHPLPPVKYFLGHHTLMQLPLCLVQTLKPAIYQCLRHDQLGVRQLASQCLVKYAGLCEKSTRLLIFQEVISKLNRIHKNDKIEVDPNNSELLDAHEAEGLLDVLACLAPHLPSGFLLKHWKLIFPTLEKYVMHIASSVRQKSSSVVLALAKLSQYCHNNDVSVSDNSLPSDQDSLRLMVEMLLSLSKTRNDEDSFCWQQKEGRLLSIDVLVNVLGESLIRRGNDISTMLLWHPNCTKPQQRQSSSLEYLQSFLWAHEQAQAATWVLDDEKAESSAITAEGDDGKSEKTSLVEAVSAWIDTNRGKSNLPDSRLMFWQQVLSGCIDQTREAFESSQFELRRISRQLLPGLLRLTIWTDQLQFISSTYLENNPMKTAWGWTCMKSILLHLRYVEESVTAFNGNNKLCISQKLISYWKIAWNSAIATQTIALNASTDSEVIVAAMEMRIMVFLCFGTQTNSPHQTIHFLDCALASIHEHLSVDMQIEDLRAWTESTINNNGTLDRQFSIILVPLLHAVTSTLYYLAEQREQVDASIINESQQGKNILTWNRRWLCLERITLSWLSTQDMFRWITLSKSEAQSHLLQSLTLLICFPNTHLSLADEQQEFDRIMNCLNARFASSQENKILIKELTYPKLLNAYLQIWLRSIRNGYCTGKNVISVLRLYSQHQQQQQHSIAVTITKKAEVSFTCPAAESWDDWDEDNEDEVQQVSPVHNSTDSDNFLHPDASFCETLNNLDDSHIRSLSESLRSVSDLAREQGIPTQHFAQMQHQIDICLQSRVSVLSPTKFHIHMQCANANIATITESTTSQVSISCSHTFNLPGGNSTLAVTLSVAMDLVCSACISSDSRRSSSPLLSSRIVCSGSQSLKSSLLTVVRHL
ncbi:unnamed protein product [Phytophthora lilii]|uniref:Unnamed protein product n=1 Tax=Phytophthora lilii TaxID=2077276 RepID=A0A9W6WXQ9_9STRA|nr:unnamed protein product [Phytophthora lilii]